MEQPAAVVRYRFARSLERYESYAFLLVWPALFTLPLGFWGWPVAFAPSIILYLRRMLWRARSPRTATLRRGESSVELVNAADGTILEIPYRDVDALTVATVKGTHLLELCLERKGKRSLVFELGIGETVATLSERLGLDVSKARSRYRISALITPYATWPVLAGFAMIAWSWLSTPDPDTAQWMWSYTKYIFLPLLVLMSIPTQFDIGRDGVAWRWLFVRTYLSFSDIALVTPKPRPDKIASFVITRKGGRKTMFSLNKQLMMWTHLHNAFAAFTQQKEIADISPHTTDAWLSPTTGESSLAWTQRLRAIATNEGGYRGVSVTHLWSLAENLDAPPMTRGAAFFAIVNNDASRERVRVLATQVVDPNFSALLNGLASNISIEDLAKLVDACHWLD